MSDYIARKSLHADAKVDEPTEDIVPENETPFHRTQRLRAARRALHMRMILTKKHGRHAQYEPMMDELVYEYRMLGLTVPQISKLFGFGETVLYQWLDQHNSFADAWLNGGEGADAEVSRAMYHRAIGYSHTAEKISFDKEGNAMRAEFVQHYAPSEVAGKFWLTNRQPHLWKERNSTELTGADGAALQPPSITITGVIAAPKSDL